MRKILDYIARNTKAVFFDVDGVLAPYEFGTIRHCISDEEWNEKVSNGEDIYKSIESSSHLAWFIANLTTERSYALSKSPENEWDSKFNYVRREYDIPKDHIIRVNTKDEKIEFLKNFSKANNIPENQIAIVEDTVETLDKVAAAGDFVTVHISSFLDY